MQIWMKTGQHKINKQAKTYMLCTHNPSFVWLPVYLSIYLHWHPKNPHLFCIVLVYNKRPTNIIYLSTYPYNRTFMNGINKAHERCISYIYRPIFLLKGHLLVAYIYTKYPTDIIYLSIYLHYKGTFMEHMYCVREIERKKRWFMLV